MWRNGRDHYGLVSIFLHWVIALAMLGLVALGAWMVGLTYYDPWYNRSLALHKAFGVLVLVLAAAKFGWRIADRSPGFGPEVKAYERIGAVAMHWLLNALIVLLPVTGYLISTSEGAGIDVFGAFEVPALFAVSEGTRDLAIEVHFYMAYGLVALVALHAGAALKHHLIDRGSTLRRMIVPRPPPGRVD
ncbi:MAG: cytochrome b [Defluviicoccus sp.]|nr:cytochrome b [Defluviicoccus sp.]MDE0276301.1 cytochrome b [Defluviicoccus sp.]